MAAPTLSSVAGRMSYMKARDRFFISTAVALVAFIGIRLYFSPALQLIGTWLAYALTVLGLMWVAILTTPPAHIRQIARTQDNSRALVFFFVIGAASASLFAVAYLLDSAKNLPRYLLVRQTVLSLSSVIISWWLLHTVFALRYAHIYYGDDKEGDMHGGLNFPEEESPDYLDFIYFSFVIGMTCQVSDVGITSRKMRRLAWGHGVLTFVFNTVIVALSINVFSSLLSAEI